MALIAYNECLCTDTSFLMVVVSPAIAPQVTCRGTVCEGTSVTYTTDADCGAFLWTISPNGTVTAGGSPADNFVSINWGSGPEGLIQLQVENCINANYCAEPNRMPVPVISENAQIEGPEQVCRSQTARYTITPFGGVEFNWSVSGQGLIESGQGTPEVVVQWAGVVSTTPQWVAVEYYNCYLDCGGRDTIWANIRPEFFITGPVEVCLDDSQNYTARRTDMPSTNLPCHWEVIAADGTVVWTSAAATATPTVLWNFGPGGYRLLARPASPGDVCIPLYEIFVQVLALPPALAGIDGADAVCAGLDYTYSVSDALPGHRVEWTLAGNVGAPLLNGNPVLVKWGTTPPYSISVRQFNPQGCAAPAVALNIAPIPPAVITGEDDACADQKYIYSAPALPQVEYDWSLFPPEAGTIYRVGNSAAIEVLWHSAGTAEVRLDICGQSVSLPVLVRPRPIPEVIAPSYVCTGETVLVETTTPYAGYAWSDTTGAVFFDGSAALLGPGYYQVSVTDDFGCRADVLFNMGAYPLPDVSLSTPDNRGLCPGDPPSTLYALVSESGYTYAWYRNGIPIAGATGPTYSTTEVGSYLVEVTDINGCKAISRQIVFFLSCGSGGGGSPGNPPGGGGPPILCPFNSFISFDIQATPDCADADTSRNPLPFHHYDIPGDYTVTLQATNIYGCSAEFSRNITVEPNGLSGTISFSSPICEGDSSLLSAPSGGVRWEWSTGDTVASIYVHQTGTYALTVQDAQGCIFEPEDVAVRVLPAPRAPIRAVEYTAAGQPIGYTYDSLSLCMGEDVFLEVIFRGGQTYLWSTGQPGVQIEFSENRGNRLDVGEYDVSVTVTETATGCTHIEQFKIIVRPLPAVPLVTANPPGNVCEGTPVVFTVNNPQAGVSYAWSTGALGTVLQTARPGQYRAIATNEWGCTNESAPRSILPGPEINLIPAGCHNRCRPDTLCFPPVPGIASYQWFFEGVAQGPVSGNVPQVVISESGAYFMRMTTNQGCTLDSEPLTVDLFDGFGDIRGQVYWDRNNNGVFDAGDSLMVNVPLILLSGNMPVDTVLSQTGGQYGFVNVLSAGYGLQLDTAALPFRLLADTVRIDTALVGCDVEVIVNWRLYCINSTASFDLGACAGSTVDFNGTPLAPGTITDFTFVNAVGCDSILTATVNTLLPSTASFSLNACAWSTVDFNGTLLTPGTTTDFTFVNAVQRLQSQRRWHQRPLPGLRLCGGGGTGL